MAKPKRWAAAIVGGLVCGIMLSILFGWLFLGQGGGVQGFGFFVGLVGFGALFLYSNSKAWARMWLSLGIMALSSPIAVFIGGAVESSRVGEQEGAAAGAGAAIGTGIATIMVGFLGFFFGAIFIILAVVSYRKRRRLMLSPSGQPAY